jgi:hypothetical protein
MGKIATTIGSQIYGNVIGTLTLLATVVGVIVMLTPSTTASATGATPMQNSHAYLFVISGIVGLVLTLPSWIGMFRKGAKPTVEGISNTPALQPRYVPTVGLTFKGSEMDPYDPTPGRGYPRKLNVYFSNDGDDIHLGVAKWIKTKLEYSPASP